MNWHWYLNYESDLQNITPDVLSAYLEGNGWEALKPYGDKGVIYASDAKGGTEIIAPKTRQSSDYTLVLNQIIETLAKSEERDGLAVLRELSLANHDQVRLRMSNASISDSISIDKGIDLLEQARILLRSAAYSALRPMPYFGAGGNRKQVSDYLKRVRLGQTEQGSFVVNLFSPLPSGFNRQIEPFSRRVTNTLASGLHTARQAIDRGNRESRISTIDLFERGVQKGVSANLCDAVGKMIGQEESCQIDVSIRWAFTMPSAEEYPSISFSGLDVPVLEDASRVLKKLQLRPNKRIEGYVESLARGRSRRRGRVSIKVMMDGSMRSVSIDFTPSDYSRVVNAHDNRQAVSIVGDLRYEGRGWTLDNPRDLVVI